MSPAERHADFPYNTRRVELERNIVIFANGIDLETPHNPSRGTLYEAQCFRYLASMAQDGMLVFGAGLVNSLFERKGLISKIKPDALTFDTSNQSQWELVALHEFKSGHFAKKEKIEGFLALIKLFRKKPQLLAEVVAEGLPKHIQAPSIVLVAKTREIEIGFFNTTPRKMSSWGIPCRLRFKYLPFESPA